MDVGDRVKDLSGEFTCERYGVIDHAVDVWHGFYYVDWEDGLFRETVWRESDLEVLKEPQP